MIECHCNKCERLAGDVEQLQDALNDVMLWINNWSPAFTYDDEWPETREKVLKALEETA